jgi:hypothetical protein
MPEAEGVLPLAQKLVGLAQEQRHALELGAREQFNWIGLRRNEVTDRLSSMLAAGTQVSEADAAALLELRTQLLKVDGTMEQHLQAEIQKAAGRGRNFARARKTVGSYLQLGPRRGFLDTQR